MQELKEREDMLGYFKKHHYFLPPKGLLIGSGNSARQVFKFEPGMFRQYNIILCLNKGQEYLREIEGTSNCIRAWLCPEENCAKFPWFWNVPATWWKFVSVTDGDEVDKRYINDFDYNDWIGVRKANDSNAHTLDVTEYGDGLATGKPDEYGNYAGTAAAQGMHLLAILGCSGIDVIGCELSFTEGEPIHFYDTEYDPTAFNATMQQVKTHFNASKEYISKTLMPAMVAKGITVRILSEAN